MRRMLIGLAMILVSLVVVAALMLATVFVGNEPMQDGRTYAAGRITTVVDGYVSCFLVKTDTGFLLVDACMDPAPIRAALQAQGATAGDVSAIFLTHGHSDHTGGVSAFRAATVYALDSELPVLEGKTSYLGPIPRLLGAVDSGVRAEPLIDGQVVEVDGTAVEVLAVPGHTAGSTAYRIHDVVLLGDNATVKHDELVPAPWVFSDDTRENLASMQSLVIRLERREIAWWVPSHSGPIQAPVGLR